MIGAFERGPAAHPGRGAGPQQIDRRARSRNRGGAPSAGKCRSCVPQPSSAGWEPSLTKPSIDQVLTNSPGSLGRSRDLRVALGDVDDLDAEAVCASARPAGAVGGQGRSTRPVSRAMSSSACLTKCDTRPGLAPWVMTAVGPCIAAGRAAPARSRAARSWSARGRERRDRYSRRARARCRCRDRARPFPGKARSARRVETSTETLSRKSPRPTSGRRAPRGSSRGSAASTRSATPIASATRAAALLGGDDGDLGGRDIDMAQQQRQDALADAAEADDDEAARERRRASLRRTPEEEGGARCHRRPQPGGSGIRQRDRAARLPDGRASAARVRHPPRPSAPGRSR